MSQSDKATAILEVIFSRGNEEGAAPGVPQHTDYLVISGKFGPRWIVPSDPFRCKSVLSEWRPYSFLSQLKWKSLTSAYSAGMLNRIPGIQAVSIDVAANAIQSPGTDASLVPVVYVGTPGPQQKAVATLVSTESGQPCAVMKVALAEEARKSLKREALTLKKLSGTSVQGAPSLLAEEESGDRIWQSVISGRLSSRKLTQAHIDWLLTLPRSGETARMDELREHLALEFEKNPRFLGAQKALLDAALSRIKGADIPLMLVHGDFAPWNLKLQKNGTMAAIDWEDADWSGLPLWDLCHFFMMQAHLFRERNPVKKMIGNSLVQQYVIKIGLSDKEIFPLVLLYSLLKARGLKGSCDEAYRTHLLSQIPLMVGL